MESRTASSDGDGATETRELIRRISDDVRTIARDEIELVRGELSRVVKTAAIEAAVIGFGAVVAVIGLAMLCAAAVVALAPVIASLALRLVVIGGVLGAIGAMLAATLALKLRRDIVPDLAVPLYEAAATVGGVKATVEDRGRSAVGHAAEHFDA